MFEDMLNRKVTVKVRDKQRSFRIYKHITLTEIMKVEDGYLLRIENTGHSMQQYGKFYRIIHSNEILEIFPIGTRFED